MEKNLMIYVLPGFSGDELEKGKREMEESTKWIVRGGLPQPSIYVFDNMEDLRDIVDTLDSIETPDGSYPENWNQQDWAEVVAAIITPARPWPLDHKCICGETLRTVCFCIEQGAFIDVRAYELNLSDEIGVECKNCGRVMLGFTCEKCMCIYDRQVGVVERILE